MDWPGGFDALLAAADRLPAGPERLALVERATELADARGDDDRAFTARRALATLGAKAGRPEVVIAALSWLLARSDDDPVRFDERSVVLNGLHRTLHLIAFPQVERNAIERLMADVVGRYERSGERLIAFDIRFMQARLLGDVATAAAILAAYEAAAGGRSVRACRTYNPFHLRLAMAMAELRPEDELVAAAGPYVTGCPTCAGACDWAHNAALNLAAPLVTRGRADEAWACHRRVAGRQPWQPGLVDEAGDQLQFLALAGARERAVALVEATLPLAERNTDPSERWWYELGAHMAFAALARAGVTEVALRLPEGHGLAAHAAGSLVDPAGASGWYLDRLVALSDAYDRRNGNAHHRAQLAYYTGRLDRVA